MRTIPHTMSTQHPDNIYMPNWATNSEILQGDDEVFEAYYVFNELGCHEQMWDWEGKDVDPHVVRKLLINFPEYFRDNKLGKDIFLTYRIPNPSVEPVEKKTLLEALESIARSYDVARDFYGSNATPPIFEIIHPLTKSHHELLLIYHFYRKFIIDRENTKVNDKISVKDFIGEFYPKSIEIIPLIEDMDSILNINEIIGKYIKNLKLRYLRVFIARSDPALNYGLIPAVLLSKIALIKLQDIAEKLNIEIYPIIGAGSPPFRGGLRPDNIRNFLKLYDKYYTVTVQSSLKYDHPINIVKSVIDTLNKKLNGFSTEYIDNGIDRIGDIERIIRKLSLVYSKRIEQLSSFINNIAELVPRRRARKLHIGLFGYSREIGKVRLPRAIEFTCIMYSIGIPPEFLGLSALYNLNEYEWDIIKEMYPTLDADLQLAANYLCPENIDMLNTDLIFEELIKKHKIKNVLKLIHEDIKTAREKLHIKTSSKDIAGRLHDNLTKNFLLSLISDRIEAKKYLIEAAKIRRFLG